MRVLGKIKRERRKLDTTYQSYTELRHKYVHAAYSPHTAS